MGLRGDKLRRLERAGDEDLITFELEDGKMARFAQGTFTECFLHEYERGRRHYDGEDSGPAHPMVEAHRKAKNLEALLAEQAMMVGAFVGEDAIMRGETEGPGPPVKEVRPGHYE